MKIIINLSIFFIFVIISFTNNSSFAKKIAVGKAAIIIDYKTKDVLFEVNADTLNYPASLTKIMTLYILFDLLDKNKINWKTQMLVSKEASTRSPSKLYLKEGTTITVEDAVMALIIKSANDVAVVVAEHISGSERKFAKLMTKYAKKIGMTKSTFKNASGLPNRAQLTTARDISILSHALISNFPEYYKLFKKKQFKWKGKIYKTHNRLMKSYEGADGIKTGYIKSSGFQLAFSAVRNNRRLIGVYFGGDTGKQRDQRLTLLMNIGFGNSNAIKTNKNIQNNSSNKYKIIVGTFKYKKNAEKQIKIIQKNYPKTTFNKEAKVIKINSNNRKLYETRFQFFSKKEARTACARLIKYKRDCFIRG